MNSSRKIKTVGIRKKYPSYHKPGYHKRYCAANKERIALRSRQWYEQNKEKARKSNKLYRLKHRKRLLEMARQRYIQHREEKRACARANYVRKLANGGRLALLRSAQHNHRATYKNYERKDLNAIESSVVGLMQRHALVCYYCKRSLTADEFHIDHVIALSMGGPHASSNVAIACPACNIGKRSRFPSEFAISGQPLLNL